MENDQCLMLDYDNARKMAVVESIEYLKGIMRDKSAKTSDRIQAAEALLNFAPVAVAELERQSAEFN